MPLVVGERQYPREGPRAAAGFPHQLGIGHLERAKQPGRDSRELPAACANDALTRCKAETVGLSQDVDPRG